MATYAPPSPVEKKPIRSFRDLKVWEKAFLLSVDVHRLAGQVSPSAPGGLHAGMREAAVAMTTQIAQGHTHSYLKDFLRCLDASLAALSDLETRVLLAGALDYLERDVCSELEERIAEVRRMDWGLVNRLRAREGELGAQG